MTWHWTARKRLNSDLDTLLQLERSTTVGLLTGALEIDELGLRALV